MFDFGFCRLWAVGSFGFFLCKPVSDARSPSLVSSSVSISWIAISLECHTLTCRDVYYSKGSLEERNNRILSWKKILSTSGLLRLSGATSVNFVPNSAIWKIFYYPVANINLLSNDAPINQQISIIRNGSVFSSFSIFNRTNSSQTLMFLVDECRNSNSGDCYKFKRSSGSIEKQVLSSEINDDDCPENLETENDKEWQRRKKIGLANKGRVPWNKGKKHNLETRKRIKQRTIEALRDPEVRRKMSEYPRTHSDQVKVKISSSLRCVWGRRLMKKRSNEKFFLSWMESIAVAAKKGGREEQKLDWDSYEKIKQEMLNQNLQRVAEKEKLKVMREENAKKKRKVQWRVGKKKKRDDNAETKKMKMCSRRNGRKRKAKESEDSQRMMKKLTATERSRLKRRLKKIRKKITINGAIAAQGSIASVIPQNTSWEKLDLDLIKRGQMRKEVSLADQIQVAKNRKADSVACKVPLASTLTYQCTGGAERFLEHLDPLEVTQAFSVLHE